MKDTELIRSKSSGIDALAYSCNNVVLVISLFICCRAGEVDL